MTKLPPRTLIKLPSGRRGVVIENPFKLKGYTLVLLENGDRNWFNSEILKKVRHHEK